MCIWLMQADKPCVLLSTVCTVQFSIQLLSFLFPNRAVPDHIRTRIFTVIPIPLIPPFPGAAWHGREEGWHPCLAMLQKRLPDRGRGEPRQSGSEGKGLKGLTGVSRAQPWNWDTWNTATLGPVGFNQGESGEGGRRRTR